MKKISEVHEEQFGITLRELGVTEGVIDCLKSQAKSELIDIQIAGLEGMKKKLPTLKTTDDIDDWSITIGKLESYNQAIDEMKAKLLKQKGE